MAVRVLVCDDSLGFPALVGSWLDADERFEHVGTAATGRALLELVQTTAADALVLDLVLPDVANPGELVRQVRERLPDVKVLLVSSLQQTELARAAGAAGVDGHLHKLTSAAELGDRLYALTASS
jgi:two-component system response regulator DesR